MKPSLQARAAYLRRLQSRRRVERLARTPNVGLPPSMIHAQHALELAWSEAHRTTELPRRAKDRLHKSRHIPRTAYRDEFGPVSVPGKVTVYADRMRIRHKVRVDGSVYTYVTKQTGAFARAHSTAQGLARLADVAEYHGGIDDCGMDALDIPLGTKPNVRCLRPDWGGWAEDLMPTTKAIRTLRVEGQTLRFVFDVITGEVTGALGIVL